MEETTDYLPSAEEIKEVGYDRGRGCPESNWRDALEKYWDELKVGADTSWEKNEEEIEEAVEREDYETADQLTALKRKVDDLVINTNSLTNDDVTDKKFQFEDNKRKIAQEIGCSVITTCTKWQIVGIDVGQSQSNTLTWFNS